MVRGRDAVRDTGSSGEDFLGFVGFDIVPKTSRAEYGVSIPAEQRLRSKNTYSKILYFKTAKILYFAVTMSVQLIERKREKDSVIRGKRKP